jgi:hypothetical protein
MVNRRKYATAFKAHEANKVKTRERAQKKRASLKTVEQYDPVAFDFLPDHGPTTPQPGNISADGWDIPGFEDNLETYSPVSVCSMDIENDTSTVNARTG